MARVILRIVSSRAPYRRAGVNFDPTGHKTIGVTLVSLDDLDEARLAQLLTDPHLDVTAGTGNAFIPVGSVGDVMELAFMLEPAPVAQPAPARGTAEILAASLAAEQARDAAAPGGDDEKTADTAADPVAGAAPPEAALGETADGGAADAPGASAATEIPPESEAGGVADSVASASPAPVAGAADGETGGDQAAPAAEAPAPPKPRKR